MKEKNQLRQEQAVEILLLFSNSIRSVLPTASPRYIELISVPEIY
jgi:hypothetical protein